MRSVKKMPSDRKKSSGCTEGYCGGGWTRPPPREARSNRRRDAIETLLGALGRTAEDDVAERRARGRADPRAPPHRRSRRRPRRRDRPRRPLRRLPRAAHRRRGRRARRRRRGHRGAPAKLDQLDGRRASPRRRASSSAGTAAGPPSLTPTSADRLPERAREGRRADGDAPRRRAPPSTFPRDERAPAARAARCRRCATSSPREPGTEAAEVQAWAQMRRQPKRRAAGASPVWALFAIAAVGGAMIVAYALAIR